MIHSEEICDSGLKIRSDKKSQSPPNPSFRLDGEVWISVFAFPEILLLSLARSTIFECDYVFLREFLENPRTHRGKTLVP